MSTGVPTFSLDQAVSCPACGKAYQSFKDVRTRDRLANGTTVCTNCGHIFRIVNGKTCEVDREKLRAHEHADEIRAAQAEIVRELWG